MKNTLVPKPYQMNQVSKKKLILLFLYLNKNTKIITAISTTANGNENGYKTISVKFFMKSIEINLLLPSTTHTTTHTVIQFYYILPRVIQS
jgi:hypothetical protein